MATPLQNSWNRKVRSDSTTGSKGVRKTKSGNFQAYINRNGKNTALGTYPTAAMANEAYLRAAHELFGEFACAGHLVTGSESAAVMDKANEGKLAIVKRRA